MFKIMRSSTPFVVLCGLLLVSACAPPSGPQASSDAISALRVIDAPAQGANGYASFEIGDVQVPLPEGKWTYLGSKVLTKGRNYPTTAHILVSETEGAVDRIVTLWRQRTFGGRFGDFNNCSAKSNLASDVASQAAGSTDCVYVRSVPWSSNGRIGPLVRNYARSKGIYAPLVTIGPRVALSLSGTERIAIDYAYAADLIAPPPTGSFWRPADWTPTTATDASRRAAIEAMREFGAVMRPQVARVNSGSS